MRRIELTWNGGDWADGVAERLVEEMIEGLERAGSDTPDYAEVVNPVTIDLGPEGVC